MVLYQGGNDTAFEVLYARYSSKVYGFLRNRVSGREVVDDIFQATFAKLHRSRERFDPSLRFAPWLFTICKTVMLDGLRKENRKEVVLEEVGEIAVPEPPEESGAGAALASLEALPRTQREAIEMRYLEDLSFEEIAERLNKSPGNVRQIVSRGIRQLQGLFRQERGQDEKR